MLKQRFWVVFAIVLVLSMSVALATFDVKTVPIKDRIFPGEVAKYEINIINNGNVDEDLRYEFVEDPSWSVITSPIYHQTSLKLVAGSEDTTIISLTPDESIEYGQKYDYNFKIASNIYNSEKHIVLPLFIKSPNRLSDYVPIVGVDADVDSEIDPRYGTKLSMLIKNFNPLNISNLVVDVRSKVNPGNDKKLEIPLEGMQKKMLNISLRYDPLQRPAKEVITIILSIPDMNKTFNPEKKNIQILPYTEVHKETIPKEYFLKTVTKIKIFNDGNVDKQESVRTRTSLFKQMFTSEEPRAEVIKDGGLRYLSWPLVLAPQETREIMITENYRPLFIIFIILLVAFALYRVLRSPILIRKEAHKIRRTENEEEISMVKVQIHIKNRTGKVVENLNIIDKIPHIAVLDKDFPVGTLQPSKVIKHEKRGSIIKWVIPALEAYEERIITYNIRFKLKIIGSLKLSSAMLKYKNKLNKFSKIYSNRILAR